MSISKPTCTHYTGSLSDIPPTSPSGLLFLKRLLPLQESTTAEPNALDPFYAPTCVSLNNAAPPISLAASKATGKREKRNKAVEAINFDLQNVWDMDMGEGRRTVVYEISKFFCA